MAAGQIPAVGSKFGPCEDECVHTDCAANRRMAAAQCVHCSKPIGYETYFFNVTPSDAPVWTVLAHESCEIEAIDKEGN